MKTGELALRDVHEVTIELAAAYPRLIPNLSWKTPIFHPNISSSGVVCLGGYGTNWVPSLTLDEMCTMLWDMIRYRNFDTESPYNKDAALWARSQTNYQFPLDNRSLRNQISGQEMNAAREPIRNSSPPPVISPAPKSLAASIASSIFSSGSGRPNSRPANSSPSGRPTVPPETVQPATEQDIQIVEAVEPEEDDGVIFID